jgi:hypothetical protein
MTDVRQNPAPTRVATCRCGALRATCTGEPGRISVCHCLNCQKRSGSAFAAQARWPDAQVNIEGEPHSWTCTAESGNRATFHFCPICSATIAYTSEGMPGVTAIPIGAFADPDFPSPRVSVYEERKHRWIAILGDEVEHIA